MYQWEYGKTNGNTIIPLNDPSTSYYNFLLNSGMSPAQQAFYKRNMSSIFDSFQKDWLTEQSKRGAYDPQSTSTQNAGVLSNPSESDWQLFLKNYNWSNNPEYNLFGQSPSNKYGFVPRTIRWV